MPKTRSGPRPRPCQICPNSPLNSKSKCPHVAIRRKSKSNKAPLQSTPVTISATPGGAAMAPPIDPGAPDPDLSSPTTSLPLAPAHFNVPGGTDITLLIDPMLLALDSPSPTMSLPCTPVRPVQTDETWSERQTPTTPNTATAKNPIYGFVEGVKRGNTKFNVVRRRTYPQQIQDSTKATRRFTRLMNDLVIRCERASAETGCWLYLSAQHVNAASGFINYASPRLRHEMKAELTDIQNTFSRLYGAALNARRTDAIRLSLQAQVAQEERDKAKQELAAMAARVTQLESAIMDNALQSHAT